MLEVIFFYFFFLENIPAGGIYHNGILVVIKICCKASFGDLLSQPRKCALLICVESPAS